MSEPLEYTMAGMTPEERRTWVKYQAEVDRYNTAVETGEDNPPRPACPVCGTPTRGVSGFLVCGDECTSCDWAYIDGGIA